MSDCGMTTLALSKSKISDETPLLVEYQKSQQKYWKEYGKDHIEENLLCEISGYSDLMNWDYDYSGSHIKLYYNKEEKYYTVNSHLDIPSNQGYKNFKVDISSINENIVNINKDLIDIILKYYILNEFAVLETEDIRKRIDDKNIHYDCILMTNAIIRHNKGLRCEIKYEDLIFNEDNETENTFHINKDYRNWDDYSYDPNSAL